MSKLLSETLLEFIQALLKGEPLLLSEGRWSVEGSFRRKMRKFFIGEERIAIALAEEFEKEIDKICDHPILFSGNASKMSEIERFDEYLLAADILDKKLICFRTKEMQGVRNRLLFKTLSFKYRIEEENGGLDASPVEQPLVNALKKMLYDWKEKNSLLPDKSIRERDIRQLQETSQYPEFVLLLLKDEAIRTAFMDWVFRDNNSPKIFIEYPQLQKRLVECRLSGRVGRVGEEELKILKVPIDKEGSDCYEKIVTLPFEGVDRNILNEESVVTLRGNRRLSVKEVFEEFKNKMVKVGDLEYFAHGITNWNCHNWGYWNDSEKKYCTIDLSHNHWWYQLPNIEIASAEEMTKRYGETLDGKSWCVSATATRGSQTLDYENTHAFLEVAIPWGDGRYAIYDFGKFARKYPSSFFEGVTIFCKNLRATVSYPDENIFYSHRERSDQPFLIGEEEGLLLMEQIKNDMLAANEGNFVYQIESENCAKWVYEHLESTVGKERLPNLFRMNLLDTEPTGAVALIFRAIKLLPHFLQVPLLTLFHRPLGAAKETWIVEKGKYLCKSLTRHKFWETGEIFLPALLHKLKEEGIIAHFREFIDGIKEVLIVCTLRITFSNLFYINSLGIDLQKLWAPFVSYFCSENRPPSTTSSSRRTTTAPPPLWSPRLAKTPPRRWLKRTINHNIPKQSLIRPCSPYLSPLFSG